MKSSADLPPGPPRRRLRTMRQMMADPAGFFKSLHRDYGDIVTYEMPGKKYCAIFSAELVEELLAKDSVFPPQYPRSRFDVVKSPGMARMRGEDHHRLSRLIASAFSEERMQIHADILAEQVEEHCGRLRAGETVDFRYVSECLAWEATFGAVFGRDMRPKAEIGRTLASAVKKGYLLSFLPGGSTVARWPLPYMLKALRASKDLDVMAYEAIRRARDPAYPGHDIVSHLLRASEQGLHDWRFENDTALRDEAFSIVFISYETQVIPLVYSVFYLSRNAAVRERLAQETDEVVGDRPLRGADFSSLRYAQAVFKELLRIQPPAETFVPRPALEDTSLAGYSIPRGTVIQVPLHVLHSRADYWDCADQFAPERWLSASSDEASPCPEGAFAPFCGGPRRCVAAPFATMLLVFALASVARRVRLEPVVDEIPKRLSADVGFFDGPILATVEERGDFQAA